MRTMLDRDFIFVCPRLEIRTQKRESGSGSDTAHGTQVPETTVRKPLRNLNKDSVRRTLFVEEMNWTTSSLRFLLKDL